MTMKSYQPTTASPNTDYSDFRHYSIDELLHELDFAQNNGHTDAARAARRELKRRGRRAIGACLPYRNAETI